MVSVSRFEVILCESDVCFGCVVVFTCDGGLFFSPIYSSLYFHVLSTVLRTSSFTLYTRSKSSLVEHSTKIQHQLLNQEYSFTITKRLPSTTRRKDRAVFTENALEGPLLSQSRHGLVFKGNLRLQINQKSTSHRRIKRFRERHAKDDPVRKIQASKQPLPQQAKRRHRPHQK